MPSKTVDTTGRVLESDKKLKKFVQPKSPKRQTILSPKRHKILSPKRINSPNTKVKKM